MHSRCLWVPSPGPTFSELRAGSTHSSQNRSDSACRQRTSLPSGEPSWFLEPLRQTTPFPPHLSPLVCSLSLARAQASIPQGDSGFCPMPWCPQATHPGNGRFPAARILGRTAAWAEAETQVSEEEPTSVSLLITAAERPSPGP